jgi:hypothetical protein
MWVSVLLKGRADVGAFTLPLDFAARDDLHGDVLYSADEAMQGFAQRFQYFRIIDRINIVQAIACRIVAKN